MNDLPTEEQPLTQQTGYSREALKIAHTGDNFILLSKCVAVLGFLIFFFGIFQLINSAPVAQAFIWSGCILSAAIWLYLVGTIVHIRSNTEK